MLKWDSIETVLLDMDGTLLDLYFDNYFWREYLPLHWGELHGLEHENAKRELLSKFRGKEGTLSWYCFGLLDAGVKYRYFEIKTGY